MERITIRNRTTKTEGEIKIRFRLRDSGGVELHHKSGIKANLKELAQFNIDGTIKGRKQIINRKLKAAIDNAMKLMSQAYANLCAQMDKTHISGELFEKEIARLANPETPTFEASKESMITRYD
ncbi:MAG: hypothetical protein K2O88_08125, partial [Paramuribaculum sp.]|nr:hypothetical protein [Paramuribaculum sp.]